MRAVAAALLGDERRRARRRRNARSALIEEYDLPPPARHLLRSTSASPSSSLETSAAAEDELRRGREVIQRARRHGRPCVARRGELANVAGAARTARRGGDARCGESIGRGRRRLRRAVHAGATALARVHLRRGGRSRRPSDWRREAVTVASRTPISSRSELRRNACSREALAARGRPSEAEAAFKRALELYDRKGNVVGAREVRGAPRSRDDPVLDSPHVLSAPRAQGRDGPVRRPRRLHVARRVARPRGRRGDPRARTTSACAPSSSATAARWRSSSATRSWRCSARRSAHEDDPERAVRAALAIRDWARARRAARGADRDHHRRGARLPRRAAGGGRGHGLGRRRQHRRAAAVRRARQRHPRRRDDVPGDAATRSTSRAPSPSRPRARPSPLRSGSRSRPARGSASTSPPRPARRWSGGARARRPDRRLRPRPPRARDRSLSRSSASPGSARADSCSSSFSNDRDRSRPDLLAPGPLASLRRGRDVLGARARWSRRRPASSRPTRPKKPRASSRAPSRSPADDDEWAGSSHLRPLVGLGEASELSEDRRAEAFAAWRRFFEGLAEQRPLVLVFEDLHWADEGLLDFVDDLVEWASGVPLLVALHGTARAARSTARLGRGQGERDDARALAPLGHGDRAARGRADRTGPAPGPDAGRTPRARRGKSALRRAVRPDAGANEARSRISRYPRPFKG